MNEAEFFARELEEMRAGFERGHYPDVMRALLLCAWNELPVPDWVAQEAETAMRFYFLTGGSEGRGKTGGLRKQHERAKVHRQRHHIADWELARRQFVGGTRADAFTRASERLSGTPARGTADQIERSFNKVQKELRDRFSK